MESVRACSHESTYSTLWYVLGWALQSPIVNGYDCDTHCSSRRFLEENVQGTSRLKTSTWIN